MVTRGNMTLLTKLRIYVYVDPNTSGYPHAPVVIRPSRYRLYRLRTHIVYDLAIHIDGW